MKLIPTFFTSNFDIYLFDKCDTGIENINKASVKEVLACSFDATSAFISAANSLGFMDGGSDLGYMDAIPRIQNVVQDGFKLLGLKSLLDRPFLPIGMSMGFKLNENIFFISAPTMVLPQKVQDTSNPYHAFLASLILCKRLNIKKVLCPMMCTGYGGYTFTESYNLMLKAVEDLDFCENPRIIYSDLYIYYIIKQELFDEITENQSNVYSNSEFFVKCENVDFTVKIKEFYERLSVLS